MGSNVYLPIERLKATLNRTDIARDVELLRVVESLSRQVEELTGRHFSAVTEARYFERRKGIDERDQLVVDDLVSVSAVASETATETWGLALVENTDYRLWRDHAWEPYTRLDLITGGSAGLGAWLTGFRSTKVTGVWGWSYAIDSTGVTIGEDMDASETDWQLSSHTPISLGETLKVDSEQIWVTAKSTSNTTNVTVERGVNGTTVATHTSGAAVYRRVYPADLEDAIMERARDLWLARTGSAQLSDSMYASANDQGSYARWRHALRRFQTGASVIV